MDGPVHRGECMWKQIIGLLALATVLAAEEQPAAPFPAEWSQLRTEHGVLAWYTKAIDHPEDLEIDGPFTKLPMLRLVEISEQEANRKNSPIRKNLETEIVANIEQAMAEEPKDAPVRLLSLSCTGLLEDWFVIGRLIQSGRKNIDLTIVDADLFPDSFNGLTELSKALQEEGVSLTISCHNSLEQCASHKFHCSYMVNSYAFLSFKKNTWGTLPAVWKLLLPKGRLFISHFQESISFDTEGKIRVLASSPENQALRKAIVTAQHNNPRDRGSSLRFQLYSEPIFVTGPLLYALSDLIEEYKTIYVFAISLRQNDMSESDLSRLISDATGGKATLHWQKKCYVYDSQTDRRDMIIFSFPGVDMEQQAKPISREIMLLGTILSKAGHWIIRGDQLGIWDIDGMGMRRAISVPEAGRKKAEKCLDTLFAERGHWY